MYESEFKDGNPAIEGLVVVDENRTRLPMPGSSAKHPEIEPYPLKFSNQFVTIC